MFVLYKNRLLVDIIFKKWEKAIKNHGWESNLAEQYTINNLKYRFIPRESRAAWIDIDSSKIWEISFIFW